MLEDCRVIVRERLMAQAEFLETGTNMFLSLSTQLKTYNTEKKGMPHAYGVMFNLLA